MDAYESELEDAIQNLKDNGAEIKQVDENKYHVFINHEELKNINGKDVIGIANTYTGK